MPEQFKPYNLDQARDEATKMEEKIKRGEAKDYKEAEKSIEDEDSFDEVKNNKKGEWKTMEIPGIGEIRYFEKTVMFPERIVKETGGVKGYIRKTIKEDYENKLSESIYICASLTNNNFPRQTFNHVIDGVYDGGGDSKGDFFKDRAVMQKIFPIEDDVNDRGTRSARENFLIFSKDGNKPLPTEDYDTFEKRQKLFSDKSIKENYYFLNIESWKGLSVERRGHLAKWGNNEIAIGFGDKNKVFKEYLEKVSLFREKNYEVYRGSKDKDLGREHIGQSIDELLSKTRGGPFTNYGGGQDHPRVPVVINYPGIPRLRWCHADYLSVYTKKGLNILEMIT